MILRLYKKFFFDRQALQAVDWMHPRFLIDFKACTIEKKKAKIVFGMFELGAVVEAELIKNKEGYWELINFSFDQCNIKID